MHKCIYIYIYIYIYTHTHTHTYIFDRIYIYIYIYIDIFGSKLRKFYLEAELAECNYSVNLRGGVGVGWGVVPSFLNIRWTVLNFVTCGITGGFREGNKQISATFSSSHARKT